MLRQRSVGKPWRIAAGTLLVVSAASVAVRTSVASDHQDTPEVELHPRLDINDVYAFPGTNANRIALVLTTSSPITAGTPAAFDPDILYQIKVDNTGDAVEDLVLQFTFDGHGAGQQVTMRGPLAPTETGRVTAISPASPTLTGATNSVLGSPAGIQLFAGLRDDPFYLDLEQFFRIIPDRAPVQGPLSTIGPNPEATAFRNPGLDYLRRFNTLAIVVELPESALLPLGAGGDPKLGIWATTSR